MIPVPGRVEAVVDDPRERPAVDRPVERLADGLILDDLHVHVLAGARAGRRSLDRARVHGDLVEARSGRRPHLGVHLLSQLDGPGRLSGVDRVDLPELEVAQGGVIVLVLNEEDALDVAGVAVEVRIRLQHDRAVRVERRHREGAAPDHRAARVELGEVGGRVGMRGPDVLRHDRDVPGQEAGVVAGEHHPHRRRVERRHALHVLGVGRVDVRVGGVLVREDDVGGRERLAVAPAHPRAQVERVRRGRRARWCRPWSASSRGRGRRPSGCSSEGCRRPR